MRNRSAAKNLVGMALKEKRADWYRKHLSNDNFDKGITEKQFAYEPTYLYFVSIEDKPITKDRLLRFDSDIKITRGQYSIQYIPNAAYDRNPKFPYLIGQDLVRIRVTVSGPRHWGCLCKRIPELGWVKRNSTMRDEMFAIAKKHPGLVLRFGVDFIKYCEKIESRAEKEGIDIDHKPLVSYLWNREMGDQVKKLDLEKRKKSKADYIKELQEVENSPTVQKEIKGR